ncbi:MAG: hypothetical protein A3A44_03410 [Candidatus Sungbacteria bacterium RIFCSPLOWO2_01_FULL_60_25]|uniref:Uncharacterized protein n=1 Tax=Candidatus Sungbacteria bacterium RIFCSPLOWO2_01_FULL_60_25 TaxID=1802281 RepID=A0A1G2LCQ6_9BACT|nr:MAG: hypothetical protein A3A44_03410 [Candidatus Sungbacteria bacterium RIFCSPLOWO2_01_FULL_60_25]
MAGLHCWTCWNPTTDNRYTCHDCESLEELRGIGDAVNDAAVRVGTAVAAGLGEVAWEIAQQREEIRAIDQTLKTPAQTKADEYREIGEESRRRGALSDAESFFGRALDASPLDGRIYIGLAFTHIKEGRFADAGPVLERAKFHVAKSGLESFRLRLLARLAACRGDFVAARKIIATARHRSDGSNGDLSYDEAQYAAQMGEVPRAVELLRQAIGDNPGYAECARTQGCFRPISGQLGEEVWESMVGPHAMESPYNAAVEEFNAVIVPLTRLRLSPTKECMTAVDEAKEMMAKARGLAGSPLRRGRLVVNAVGAMRRAIELAKADVSNFENTAMEARMREASGRHATVRKEEKKWSRHHWADGPGYKPFGIGIVLAAAMIMGMYAQGGPRWGQFLDVAFGFVVALLLILWGIGRRLWWHGLSEDEVRKWLSKR